jgi:hypothetical protein
MSTPDFLLSLQNSSFGQAIAGSTPGNDWWFPSIETVHVLALTIVFGSILLVDLRLLGISAKRVSMSKLSDEVLPWTWRAWIVAAITGSLLFISKADAYWNNFETRMKFFFMLLAGINMLVFQMGAYKGVASWDKDLPPPGAARLADGERREAGRRPRVGGAEDHEQEHGRHHDLAQGRRDERVAAGRMLAVPVGSEARGDIEAGLAAGDEVQHAAGCHGADDLRHDVGHELAGGEPAPGPQAHRHRRVQVTARDRGDGVGHGHHGEAERQ